MAKALHEINAIPTSDPDVIVHETVCNDRSTECMLLECNNCENKKIAVNSKFLTQNVVWHEWTTIKEKREIKRGKNLEFKDVAMT